MAKKETFGLLAVALALALAMALAMAIAAVHVQAEPLSSDDVIDAMSKTLRALPYIQARYSTCKVASDGLEVPLATWETGYTPDGRQYVKGTYPTIDNYTEHFAYNGQYLFTFTLEHNSGTISEKYCDSFNIRRGPHALAGGWYENRYPMRLDQLLASIPELTMTADVLDGRRIWKMEGLTNVNGSETLVRAWVDPNRDYLSVKSELVYPHNGIAFAVTEVDRFERIEDHWIPVEGKIKTYLVTALDVTQDGRFVGTVVSWDVKPLDPDYAYEKVVVHEVAILPEPPGGAFEIEYPVGARLYNDILQTGGRVLPDDPVLGESVRRALDSGQHFVTGTAIASASEKYRLENPDPPAPGVAALPEPICGMARARSKWLLAVVACAAIAGAVLVRRNRAHARQA